jgi:NADH-quinone oxidoreductase subunit N
LFAAAPKIILFSLIIKVFSLIFYDFTFFLSPIFLFVSVLSIVIGSVSAIYQKRLKRLFAYSTIAHTGFILLGFVGAAPEGTQCVIFYLVIYSALTILLFSLLIFAILFVNRFPAYLSA